MSLWSYISGNSSSQSGSSYINSTVSAALARIQGTGSVVPDASTPATSDTGVSISANAQAAAVAEDNKKDFGDLAREIRSSLDTLYAAEKAAGKPQTANFPKLSGRALSAVVLDEGNQFTPAEQHQAKAALDQQTRDAFASATQGGMSMGSLTSYSESLVTQYDAMSAEERKARGWTPAFRDNAAKVVSEGSLSLFDQIDG